MPVWKRSQKDLRSGAMIRSRQNVKLKDMRRLRRCKGDKALLEGPRLVGEARAAGVPLESLLMSPELLARAEGRELAGRAGCEIDEVAGELLAELMDANAPW